MTSHLKVCACFLEIVGSNLALCSFKVADDHGMFWSMEHAAQFLAQFQGSSSYKTRRLASNPNEDFRPTVQNVNTFSVQKALELQTANMFTTRKVWNLKQLIVVAE